MDILLMVYVAVSIWLVCFGIATLWGKIASDDSWWFTIKLCTGVWLFIIMVIALVMGGNLLFESRG